MLKSTIHKFRANSWTLCHRHNCHINENHGPNHLLGNSLLVCVWFISSHSQKFLSFCIMKAFYVFSSFFAILHINQTTKIKEILSHTQTNEWEKKKRIGGRRFVSHRIATPNKEYFIHINRVRWLWLILLWMLLLVLVM